MTKHRILIIEDNLSFAINLELNLLEWGYDVIGIVDNAKDAFEIIEKKTPSLILMDINIKGHINGLEIASKVQDKNIPVIFATSRRDDETFESVKSLNGVSFLVKPFDLLTLKGCLELNIKNKEEGQNVYLKKNKVLYKVPVQNILYVKSDQNYCDIYSEDNYFVNKISLKKLMEILPKNLFVKVHKSYLVNISSITEINVSKNQVKIKDQVIPIGRNFKKSFLEIIKKGNKTIT